MNIAIIAGRLGGDPELSYTKTGKAVCNLSVATGSGDRTEWHKIVVWEQLAENCEKYLSKGSQVIVRGYLKTDVWEDRLGQTRRTTKIQAVEITFGDRAPRREAAVKPETQFGPVGDTDWDDDDIPF